MFNSKFTYIKSNTKVKIQVVLFLQGIQNLGISYRIIPFRPKTFYLVRPAPVLLQSI